MKTSTITLLLTLALVSIALALPPRLSDTELAWSKWLATQLQGEAEVTYDGGRVDILTKTAAIEVEWAKAPNGPESLEQATRYGRAFDRQPVVIFLIGRGNPVAEKAIAATVGQFGKQCEPPVRVITFDVRDPDLERLRRMLNKQP